MSDQPKPELPAKFWAWFSPNVGEWCLETNACEDGIEIDTQAAAKLAKVEAVLSFWEGTVPPVCPITNRPFFMIIKDEQGIPQATYGGPFDSYTIPEIEDYGKGTPLHERSMTCRRYDHDAGAWVEGCETIGIKLIDEQVLIQSYDDDGKLITQDRLEKVERERDILIRFAWMLTDGFSNTTLNAITSTFQCGGGPIPADVVARIRSLANLPATGEKDEA